MRPSAPLAEEVRGSTGRRKLRLASRFPAPIPLTDGFDKVEEVCVTREIITARKPMTKAARIVLVNAEAMDERDGLTAEARVSGRDGKIGCFPWSTRYTSGTSPNSITHPLVS